ncbi:DUF4307 domain-containing protein [Litorihabitans aurantiacus]|uniref:DUF4307 domain-containing protein n=1 Tax=Litorihabitans aurantiacus TaxID=1930061 RepID=A0AA37UHE1_9MICO|nr:DUF4307 domain-containing protein [Litorihabitans aurantiacus]GMA30534.1 hypothetical protein GCM10025875_05260 [Litorihabitans aurantiacus]
MSTTRPAATPGGADPEERARLERRYGTRGRGRGADGGTSPSSASSGRVAAIAAGVIAVVGTGIAAWLVLGGSGASASVTGSSYQVLSDSSVRVAFSVVRDDADVAFACSVQALDASHAQVGVTVVEIPAGGARTVPVSVDVTTFARAEQADAIANGCLALED